MRAELSTGYLPASARAVEVSDPLRVRAHIKEKVFEALAFSLPLAVAQVYFKFTFLHWFVDVHATQGLRLAKGALGISTLSVFEYARFYLEDATEALVVFPILLFVILWGIRAPWRRWLCFLLVQALVALEVIAWLTYQELGTFPTSELVTDFLHAYSANAAIMSPSALLPPELWLRAGVVVSLPLLSLLMQFARIRRFALRYLFAPLCLCPLVPASFSVALFIAGSVNTVYHAGYLESLARGLSRGRSEITSDLGARWTPQQLKTMYNDLVFPDGIKPPPPLPFHLPSTSGPLPNILLVILETAAHRDYSFTDPYLPIPNIKRLLPHSLLAERHFSSHNYSARTDFTLLASIYDLAGPRSVVHFLQKRPPRRLHTLPWILRGQGYETRYYFPGDFSLPGDELATRYAGFEIIYHGSGRLLLHPPSFRVLQERRMFEQVVLDLGRREGGTAPLFVTVRTMIGHDPLIDPVSIDPSPAGRSREYLVRATAAFTDRLVGDILSKLREVGQHENTMIVIVGDHGRRRRGDPDFDSRYSNEVTFHVPFLIYYPRAFKSMVTINNVTSHVDVTPTILALLEMDTERWLHHGLPMFDPRIKDRITFFLSEHTGGTSALGYRGWFFMRNSVTGMTFLSDRFRFSSANLVSPQRPGTDTPAARFYEGRLNGLWDVQRAWISHLGSTGRGESLADAEGESR